jgi:hypothetical protein
MAADVGEIDQGGSTDFQDDQYWDKEAMPISVVADALHLLMSSTPGWGVVSAALCIHAFVLARLPAALAAAHLKEVEEIHPLWDHSFLAAHPAAHSDAILAPDFLGESR